MTLDIPDEIPAMTLANTVLLPQTVLPLYIFETRYRRMLADSLAGDRMFAILNTPQVGQGAAKADESAYCPVATVGLIRMSSLNSDGTSTVMLQGAQRVRVLGIAQESPYRKIRVESIADSGPALSPKQQSEKRAEIMAQIRAILPLSNDTSQEFLRLCSTIEDAESLASFALQTLTNDPMARQSYLEQDDPAQRIEFALSRLRAVAAELRLRKELQDQMPESESPEN